MLYLCATPIGNLEDITLRVLRILREADVIAAEDTRQTLKLLSHYEIRTRLISYHEHSSCEREAELLSILKNGGTVALVSDAGMPSISDPGSALVRACQNAGIGVTCCPGASALTTALALCGFPAGSAVFEGFLPRDKSARNTRIQALREETRTTVIYESPHRLLRTLTDLASIENEASPRRAAVMSELTKLYERCIVEPLVNFPKILEGCQVRGEVVIVLEGITKHQALVYEQEQRAAAFTNVPIAEHVAQYIGHGMPKMQAIKAAARERGVPKAVVYNALLSQTSQE